MLLRLATLLILAVATVAAPPAAAAPATSAPAPTPVPAAPWEAPLSGPLVVAREFHPPPDRFGPGHRGVDLTGSAGQPVRAAGDGVVAFAGMVGGRPVVSIAHPDGLRTTYEPVEPSVAAGRSVSRGAVIGTLLAGHPGCPASACLHWGLRRGEAYLDPLLLLHPPRVRLLPWH